MDLLCKYMKNMLSLVVKYMGQIIFDLRLLAGSVYSRRGFIQQGKVWYDYMAGDLSEYGVLLNT